MKKIMIAMLVILVVVPMAYGETIAQLETKARAGNVVTFTDASGTTYTMKATQTIQNTWDYSFQSQGTPVGRNSVISPRTPNIQFTFVSASSPAPAPGGPAPRAAAPRAAAPRQPTTTEWAVRKMGEGARYVLVPVGEQVASGGVQLAVEAGKTGIKLTETMSDAITGNQDIRDGATFVVQGVEMKYNEAKKMLIPVQKGIRETLYSYYRDGTTILSNLGTTLKNAAAAITGSGASSPAPQLGTPPRSPSPPSTPPKFELGDLGGKIGGEAGTTAAATEKSYLVTYTKRVNGKSVTGQWPVTAKSVDEIEGKMPEGAEFVSADAITPETLALINAQTKAGVQGLFNVEDVEGSQRLVIDSNIQVKGMESDVKLQYVQQGDTMVLAGPTGQAIPTDLIPAIKKGDVEWFGADDAWIKKEEGRITQKIQTIAGGQIITEYETTTEDTPRTTTKSLTLQTSDGSKRSFKDIYEMGAFFGAETGNMENRRTEIMKKANALQKIAAAQGKTLGDIEAVAATPGSYAIGGNTIAPTTGGNYELALKDGGRTVFNEKGERQFTQVTWETKDKEGKQVSKDVYFNYGDNNKIKIYPDQATGGGFRGVTPLFGGAEFTDDGSGNLRTTDVNKITLPSGVGDETVEGAKWVQFNSNGDVIFEDKEGKVRICRACTGGEFAALSKAAKEKAKAEGKKKDKGKSPRGVKQFMQDVLSGYAKYSGLNFFTNFFGDEKEIAKKKAEILDDFCDTVILGGTKCWTSKICERKVDATMGGTGVVTTGEDGRPKAAAHIEADISDPIEFYNASSGTTTAQYLYRISYSIHNPHDYNMSYNLQFSYEGGVIKAFDPGKMIKPGSTRRHIHRSAVTKYSSRLYDQICLTWTPAIERVGGGSASQICNPVDQSRLTKKVKYDQIFENTGGDTGTQNTADWGNF